MVAGGDLAHGRANGRRAGVDRTLGARRRPAASSTAPRASALRPSASGVEVSPPVLGRAPCAEPVACDDEPATDPGDDTPADAAPPAVSLPSTAVVVGVLPVAGKVADPPGGAVVVAPPGAAVVVGPPAGAVVVGPPGGAVVVGPLGGAVVVGADGVVVVGDVGIVVVVGDVTNARQPVWAGLVCPMPWLRSHS